MDKHKFLPVFNFHVILGKGRGRDGKVSSGKAKSPKRSPQFLPRVPKDPPATLIEQNNDATAVSAVLATSPKKKRSGKPRPKNKKATFETADGQHQDGAEETETGMQLDQDPLLPLIENIPGSTPGSETLSVSTPQFATEPIEDPFQYLVDSVKKLSLVPRSVSHKPKTVSSLGTKPSASIASSSTTSMQIERPVHVHQPSSNFPPPIMTPPTISKTDSWTSSESSFDTNNSSISNNQLVMVAASSNSSSVLAPKYQGHMANHGGVWTREKVLSAYTTRIPARAKEAERLWKEKRALRVGVASALAAQKSGKESCSMGEDDDVDVMIDFDSDV
ncbi:UNVERIFIED_CONTAM: hypothetical protein HDU68_008105 [Siphonaria sp. JEL0065]|nr:hypothetical protein HDU68_008105 [Siphonaria sp. JEL0065]